MLLGVSPYHPKIINQIRWLINNPKMWTGDYDRKKVCSFTYIMLVSTLFTWLYGVGNVSAAIFLNKAQRRGDKLKEILLGVRPFNYQPVKIITNARLTYFAIGVPSLFFIFKFFNQTIALIWKLLSLLLIFLTSIAKEVVIGLIVAGILAVLGFVWRSVAKKRGKKNG
ncbi:hypothetical protein SDC9_193183 [bioreactor metagenome]|uniref:Uncharacterized protein n=1 Tax=bioreactor metagenome TaxID=1076179 RepID=A0A645I2V7_9ZZZZ